MTRPSLQASSLEGVHSVGVGVVSPVWRFLDERPGNFANTPDGASSRPAGCESGCLGSLGRSAFCDAASAGVAHVGTKVMNNRPGSELEAGARRVGHNQRSV